MKHETILANWKRKGRQREFTMRLKTPAVLDHKFRGRGLKQLTGRANYRALTRDHEALFGEAFDFERNPDLLSEPKYAVRSAIFFWVDNNLHPVADRGITRSATDAITRAINRHTDSYDQPWNNTRRIHREGTFSNVCKFSVAASRFEDQ